jgi:hypothetical protein
MPFTTTATPTSEEFVAQASDLECLTNWSRVRHYRITNKLEHLAEAMAIADGSSGTSGLHFPGGDDHPAIPTEAIVKRGGGFDPANNNWKYFSLKVDSRGATIAKRSRDDVVNFQGGNCFRCHSAAHSFDFICETNHGCIQLGLTDQVVEPLQMSNPRCSH